MVEYVDKDEPWDYEQRHHDICYGQVQDEVIHGNSENGLEPGIVTSELRRKK